MNARFYKLVFSKTLGQLVVVPEICVNAQSGGTPRSHSLSISRWVTASLWYALGALSLCCLSVSQALAEPAANALPTGGQVASGQVSISTSGNSMQINQGSDKAIVNWQSFDIGASASVHIQQPNSSSTQLDRVVGASPSQIFGRLSSNGNVILVNPNGVLFGKSGSVNAGGFTASTLDIKDEDFLNGKMHFSGNSPAGVENQGRIEVASGGYVALMGAKVTNSGTIVAPKGAVGLVAGGTVQVPVTASGKITFELSPDTVNGVVSNTPDGVIVANDGQVYLKASAVNRSLDNVLESGSIDVSGEQGGQVELLSDGGNIKVEGTVRADASARDAKGGAILIGRDVKSGKLAATTDIRRATLSAQHRGWVETSGDYLQTDGVTLSTDNWLLDPADIVIGSGSDSGYSNSSGSLTPGSGVSSTRININTLNGLLNAGTNVTITTTNTGTAGNGSGNITLTSAVQKSAGGNATLTLTAANTLSLNAGISSTSGQLTLNLTGSGAVVGSNGLVLNSVALNTHGGDLTLNGSATDNFGVYVANGSSLTANNITVTGSNAGTTGGAGVLFQRDVATSATGNLLITGNTTGSAGAAMLLGSGVFDPAVSFTVGGTTHLIANKTDSTNTSTVMQLAGIHLNSVGDISIQANTPRSDDLAISLVKELSTSAGNQLISSADVIMQTNQGSLWLSHPESGNLISASNLYIDNTGGSVNGTNHTLTAGLGTSTREVNSGVSIFAPLAASGALNILGAMNSTNTNGVLLGSETVLSADRVTVTGSQQSASAIASVGGIFANNIALSTVSGATLTGSATDGSLASGVFIYGPTAGNLMVSSGNLTIQGSNGAQGISLSNSVLTATGAGQSITLMGNVDSDVVQSNGIQFGNAAGINATQYTVTGSSSATGSNNASSGLYFSYGISGFTSTTNSTMTGSSLNSGISILPTGNGTLTNKVTSNGITVYAANPNFSANNGSTITLNGDATGASGSGFFSQTNGPTLNSGTMTINGSSSQTVGSYFGYTTVNNGSTLNVFGTSGSTNNSGIAIGGGTGITANNNSVVNLNGSVSNGGRAVDISGYVVLNSGSSTNIVGTNGGSGLGVFQLYPFISPGFGVIGSATAGAINITGTSATGTGVQLMGQTQSQSTISVTGSTAGAGSYGVLLNGTTYGGYIQVASGGSDMTGSNAITISGKNTNTLRSGSNQGVLLNLAINNNSKGGNTQIISTQSGITLGGSTNYAEINHASSAGAITLSAGNGSSTSAATIYSYLGSPITQNSNAGVSLSTDGQGNLTVPTIVNKGRGNVTLAAGKLLPAGTATGGQVLTRSGNTVTNSGGGQLLVYSGSSTATGKLSYLTSDFNYLFYNGSSNPLNAQFNTAFGSTMSGTTANSQVLFRENPLTPPSFTLTLPNLTKTYGDSDPTNLASAFQTAYTAAGGATNLTKAVGNNTFALAASDVISTLTGTRTAGENVGNYTYTLNPIATALATSLSAQPKMVITKRNITLASLTASDKVYDATTAANIVRGTFNNLAFNDTLSISGSGSFSDVNVGNGKTVSVSNVSTLTKTDGTGLWSNYNLTTTAFSTTASITPAPLTITAVTSTKTYDSTISTSVTPTVSGLKGSDTVSGLSESYSDKNAANGKTLSVNSGFSVNDGNNGNNYTVTTVDNTTGVINKAALTITALTNTKTYDGTTTASATPTVSGLQGSDTVTGLSESYDTKSAGTGKTMSVNSGYTVNDGNSGGNYTVTLVTNPTGVVTKANATVTGTLTTDTYNATTQTQTAATTSGFVAGDAITVSGLASGYNAGTYASSLAVSGVDAGNYNVTITNANLVINKAALTLTAQTDEKSYDATTVSYGTPVATGLQGSDTVSNLSQVFADKNVGTGKTLSVKSGYVVNDGNSGNNYTVTLVNDTTGIIDYSSSRSSALAIAPQTTLTYNGSVQNQNAAVLVGIFSGDNVTITGGLASGTNAGTYSSNLTLGGTDLRNYQIKIRNNTLVINPAPLTLTATTNNKVYDGTTAANATPTVSGLLGRDTISGLSEVYVDKNVGVGKTLNVASTYNLSDGNSGKNYTVITQQNSGTITPANATVRDISSTRVYNGNTQILSPTTSGFIAQDNIAISGTASGRNVGSYTSSLAVTGSDVSNYNITLSNGTLTITPAPLVISAIPNIKYYDGNTTALAIPTVTGLMGSDTIIGLSEFYASVGVGTGKELEVDKGYLLQDGNGGGNYTVTVLNSHEGVIRSKDPNKPAYNGKKETRYVALCEQGEGTPQKGMLPVKALLTQKTAHLPWQTQCEQESKIDALTLQSVTSETSTEKEGS